MADVGAVTIAAPVVGRPDAAARADADELRRSVEGAAESEPWADLDGARTVGYRQMVGDPLHWYDPAAVADDRIVDPRHPEFLMFDEGGTLLGVMFLAPSDDGHTDPPVVQGSPIVGWHLHRWSSPVCLGEGGLVAVAAAGTDGSCPDGAVAATNSPWMFHVWLTGDDPFAAEMHPSGHHH